MTINNKGKFRFWEITRQFSVLVSGVYVVGLLFWKAMPLEIIYVGGIFVFATILLVGYTMALGLTYFSFERDRGVCTFKYFTSYLIGRSHKRIIIPEEELSEAILEVSFNGMKKELLLKQRTRKGLAAYAPINLSFLSTSQATELINTLVKITVRSNG